MNTKQNYLLGILVCIALQAATAQSLKNEVQILEIAYGLEKKDVIEKVMDLSGKEASDFWSLYDDYEDERMKLGEQRLLLVNDYVTAYPTLSDKDASEITSRCFRNDQALDRLHKRYYKKVKRILSPLKAAQFVQVEGYLQNAVRLQIQSQIPFIGEIIPSMGTYRDPNVSYD